MKQDEMLKAHQDVLLALARLDVVLAKYEPDDPYREDIRTLIREFGTAIDSIEGSPSVLARPSQTLAADSAGQTVTVAYGSVPRLILSGSES